MDKRILKGDFLSEEVLVEDARLELETDEELNLLEVNFKER